MWLSAYNQFYNQDVTHSTLSSEHTYNFLTGYYCEEKKNYDQSWSIINKANSYVISLAHRLFLCMTSTPTGYHGIIFQNNSL